LRQHLDTAPVLEKMRAGGECPLCALKKENEAAYVEYFLGGSVMEVSTRVEVNRKGFCARHLKLLFDANNRLGLALMQSSHLAEVLERIKARPAIRRGLFVKKEAAGAEPGCALCDRLSATMRRYALTVAALWEQEKEFKGLLQASKGFCLPHYEMIREEAPGALNGQALQQFLDALDKVEVENLERLQREVDWFAQKHDYRNQDKPWGESRDAVERCAKKLRGR
jgi:hypothetical protein